MKFLRKLAQNPAAAAAELLPAAARANRAIFFDGSAPRSLADVHALLANRFEGGAPASGKSGTALPFPAQPSGTAVPAMAEARPGMANAEGTAPDLAEARRAARAAYLLLAELGA